MAATQSFLIEPNAALLLYSVLLCTGVIGGVVTLAKGRIGWFVMGLLTVGLLWNLTAFQMANPDSAWARRFYARDKLARARARSGGAHPA